MAETKWLMYERESFLIFLGDVEEPHPIQGGERISRKGKWMVAQMMHGGTGRSGRKERTKKRSYAKYGNARD